MKKFLGLLLVLTMAIFAAVSFAAEHSHGAMKMGGKAGSWKGEVLDAGCYLHMGSMGEKHKECALKCAQNGMPLMLLVGQKAILLTPNHDNEDPYNQLKTLAGSMVEVTGTYSERGGVAGIDVTGAKAAK
jgi:hypothetical protein